MEIDTTQMVVPMPNVKMRVSGQQQEVGPPPNQGPREGSRNRVVMSANGGLIFNRKVELRRYYRTIVAFRGGGEVNETVDFAALVAAVKAESFSAGKLDVVRTAEASLTVDQVGQLVGLLSFSAEKVKVVEITNQRLVDRQNALSCTVTSPSRPTRSRSRRSGGSKNLLFRPVLV